MDLERCKRIDPSYTAQHVWHMHDERGPEQFGVWFERVRLPRPVSVRPPYQMERLFELQQNGRRFLVVEEEVIVRGYLCLRTGLSAGQLLLEQIVVDKDYRRKGYGKALLQGALRLAEKNALWQIQVIVQCQNDPGVIFLKSSGYQWTGFIDHYDRAGDVGLVFARRV